MPEPTPAAIARAQVRRLEAFVKVAATQDAAWQALGAEADALLARARALADAADAAPAPVESPGPEPEATVAAPEPAEAVRAETDAPSATPDVPDRTADLPDAGTRRPVDVVQAALPDVAAALADGQAALVRARRTGHRPPTTTARLAGDAARVARIVGPALGTVVDGDTVTGPADAVAVVELLATALAPRMGRRGAERLREAVAALRPWSGATPPD